MLIDSDWCCLMLIDSDWFLLMLIDAAWWCLMLINRDWCWLIPIDAEWCWLILMDPDCFWLMLIDADWCCLRCSKPSIFSENTPLFLLWRTPKELHLHLLCTIFKCLSLTVYLAASLNIQSALWSRSISENLVFTKCNIYAIHKTQTNLDFSA